jgi:hypothetical protein
MTIPDDAHAIVETWIRLLAVMEAGCPACRGSGRVLAKPWLDWRERAEELTRVAQAARRAVGMRSPADSPNVMAAIERAVVDHERARPHGPEQVACEHCRGYGKVLTGIGERVADMLCRHGFVRDLGRPDPWI